MKTSKIYLISSDEPLLRDEAIKKIELLAKQAGYCSIKRWQVDAHFNWVDFFAETQQRDLFSEKCLLELKLNASKLNPEASQALIAFLATANDQQLLLLSCHKLDKTALNSRWLSAIAQYGRVIQLWAPTETAALVNWLATKAADYGLQISHNSLTLIAINSEGNLSAGAQMIEKLFLRYGRATLGNKQVEDSLYDSSRYSASALVESWLRDDKPRMYKILSNLKASATDPMLIWWALTAECRLLAQLQFGLTQQQNLTNLLSTLSIWKKREPLLKMHLSKAYNYPAGLQKLVFIEHIIKGIETGNVWDELENFLFLPTS